MVRVKTTAFLYALALLLLPFTYAIKGMLVLVGIPWVDPSLILGFIIFALTRAPIRDKRALWVVCWAFFSAFVGSFFLGVSAARGKSALYIEYVEPIRLSLTVIWFWVSIEFVTKKRDFVVRWLAISALVQLLLATYLYMSLYDLVPVPLPVELYLNFYKGRQVVWFGDTAVYRMAGTFIESPPFGLFMFSCLVIFGLWLATPASFSNKNRRRVLLGAGVSFVGAVASLSDQIFLAVIIFVLTWYFVGRKKFAMKSRLYRIGEPILALGLLLACGYTMSRVSVKWDEAASAKSTATDVEGQPGIERAFHLRYGLERFEEVPLAIWTGIGPGRYGDYASRTGLFPSSVTIQNMPLTWLVEYGLFGTGFIVVWLWNIERSGHKAYGKLAVGAFAGLMIACISQGTWYGGEAWFLALAFLYASGRSEDSVGLLPHERSDGFRPGIAGGLTETFG
jgi:hypothetical protein